MARTLVLPLSLAVSGGLSTYEQGEADELAQSVGVLLDTAPGERGALPTYGLSSPIGSGLSVDDIVVAVNEWEERANPADIEVLVTDAIAQAATVRGTLSSGQEA